MIILRALWSACKWAKNNPHEALDAFLVVALCIAVWMYHHKAQVLEAQKAVAEGLAADLKSQVKVVGNQVEILKRENGKVTYKNVYVPPEGFVVVRQKDQSALQAQLDSLTEKLRNATPMERPVIEKAVDDLRNKLGVPDEVTVKNKGLTFKPGFGADWGGRPGPQLRLDFKFSYWDRYGLLFGGSRNGAGLGVSRHVDDFVFGKPQNIELFCAYDFLFPSDPRRVVVGGIRANF